MPMRAFGAMASATISQIVQAIAYAVDRGADVINMGFSVKQNPMPWQARFVAAARRGVICVDPPATTIRPTPRCGRRPITT